MTKKTRNLSRRKFLGDSLAVGAGIGSLNILASGARGQEGKLNKLNLAFVGAGGRAGGNLGGCEKTGENIYALCDVDEVRATGAYKKFGNARRYVDWREMLEKEGDKIDAVVVSTPDHLHAVSTMAAIKMGKHVYVEKPLTVTISEARALHAAAKKHGVCTQMGNTGHAAEGARLTNEWVQSGAIGDVAEVHCRTNRPIWPQDILRPPAEDVPASMNWDLWLGPAPNKPYSSKIAPFKWRGYLDYGTGALGDMGAHIIDHPVWSLGLGLPEKVVVVEADRDTPGAEKETHPQSCIIDYYFPAKEGRGPVKLRWFDGKYEIPRPAGMVGDKKPPQNGCLYLGSKHTMMHNSHGGNPSIVDGKKDSFVSPPKTEERSPGHYQEWIDAIRANDPSLAKSNFDVAAPLTEILLLGVMGSVVGKGTELTWDGESMKTGNEAADALVEHNYREGWKL